MEKTAKELWDDIFWGRVYLCDKCRRKNEYGCSNAMCLKECEYMVGKEKKQKDEQYTLF